MEGAAPQSFLPTIEESDVEGDDESVSMCNGGDSRIFAEEGGDTDIDSERHATGTVNRQQAMNVLEMEERRKVRRKKKCEMARPNDKLVVGARMIYNRKMEDIEVEKYKCRLVAHGSGWSKGCITRKSTLPPATA